MKKIKVKKSGFFLYLVISALFPITLYFFNMDEFIKNPFKLFPSVLPFGIFMWIFITTKYSIVDCYFIYSSGFIKGKIDIYEIDEVIIGKTLWVGSKPALSKGGIVIRTKKQDEIYIAPENNTDFVQELLKINALIKCS